MKKNLYALAVLAMVFACAPDNNDNDSTPTPVAAVTVGTSQISPTGAVLHGKAVLGSSAANGLKVGFQYSESSDIPSLNSVTVDAGDVDADYNFSRRS